VRGLALIAPAEAVTIVDVLVGLSAAIGYGTADFAGGLTAKRLPTQWSLLLAQTLAFPLSIVFAFLGPDAFTWSAAGRGVVAGVASGIAFTALYRGLAVGPMGVVGGLAAGTSAAIPVAVGVVGGDRFSSWGSLGLVLVVVSGLLVAASSRDEHGARSLTGPMLGLVAGLSFGVSVVGLAGSSPSVWRISGERVGIATFIGVSLLFNRPALGQLTMHRVRLLPLNVVCDVTATWLLIESARRSSLSLTGALQSLFPLVTALLAAIFLRERLGRMQLVALFVAIMGAAALGMH
jgi:drug/metabolite transporter (DMT)-like permease